MKAAALLVIVLTMAATVARAAPGELSIDDALALARAASPELQTQRQSAEAARRDLDNAWNLFLPGISSGLSGKWSSGLFTGPGSASASSGPFAASISLGAKFGISTGIHFDLRKRRTDWQVASLAEEETRARVNRDSAKAYFSLASVGLDLDIKVKALAVAGERKRLAQLRFERGLGSELDALRAEMSELNARAARDRAVAEHDKKLAAFRRLLGLPADAPVVLTTALEAPPLPALASASGPAQSPLVDGLAVALEGRIDLRRDRLAIEVASDAIQRYLTLNRLPVVSLEADYSFRVNDLFKAGDSFRDTLSLGASLSFNPDAWLPNSRKALELRNLREAGARLEARLAQDRRNSLDELRALLRDIGLAHDGIRLAESQLNLSLRIHARTQEAWERGAATALELEDAALALDTARQSLVNGRYQYLALLIDLGYALNRDWRSLAD